MSKNFRRVSSANKGSSANALNEYLGAKIHYQEASEAYTSKKREFDDCLTAITNCEAELKDRTCDGGYHRLVANDNSVP